MDGREGIEPTSQERFFATQRSHGLELLHFSFASAQARQARAARCPVGAFLISPSE
jgi:hypothetical protein